MGETIGVIIDWFVEQDEIVQEVVLGNVPPGLRNAYTEAVRSMADQFERAAKARAALDAGRAAKAKQITQAFGESDKDGKKR